jgi:hypothetical protein
MLVVDADDGDDVVRKGLQWGVYIDSRALAQALSFVLF